MKPDILKFEFWISNIDWIGIRVGVLIVLVLVLNVSDGERHNIQSMGRTPVRLNALLPGLDAYPNRKTAVLLRNGFANGFRLGYSGPRKSVEAPNARSAVLHAQFVMTKLNKEIDLGRIAGPFLNPPFSIFRVSPLGVVPKSAPGKYRLIHNLSWPGSGGSVNDGIDRDYCRVSYSRFEEAVDRVASLGNDILMAKADIESAFRLLPIHPDDFNLLGIKVNGLYYVDKCLPMGASSSPALFEAFSTFIEWLTREEAQCDRVLHYADDFFIMGTESGVNSCSRVLRCFEDVCVRVGVPLANEKTVGPVSCLTYLGLEIDSANQVVRIPISKIKKLVTVVEGAIGSSKLSRKQLQSIIGSLSFVCRAIAPGRPFLRRLINLTLGLKQSWHRVRVSAGAREDLSMWKTFLASCNGVAMFPVQFWLMNSDIQLFTDASGGVGFGGYFEGSWFQGRWPERILASSPSIAWMEFFPILVAVHVWGPRLSGKKVTFRSDNSAVVAIINKQTSPCSSIMRLVRFFVLQCLNFNVCFRAVHIPGVENDIADSLSRFQEQRFKRLAPGAARSGVKVPEDLWNL